MSAVVELPAEDLRGPGDVLAEAFHDDPTLRWCFGGDEPGFDARLRGYLEVGHRWHTGLGHPVHGIRSGSDLVAASYAILPGVEPTSEQVLALRRGLVERCGERWAERFAEYNARVEAAQPEGRFHGIALVGVLPAWRRRGLGARLVQRVVDLCEADAGSAGVLLDTATDANLRFYRTLGFHRLAEVAFEGFVERVMLRPRHALVTARLRLRPVAPDDLEALHALWCEPAVRRFLFDDRRVTLEEARGLLEASARNFAERGWGLWRVDPVDALHGDDAAPAGFAGFLRARDGSPDLIYGMHPDHTGAGRATEATRAVLARAFARGERSVQVSVDEPNAASVRVLEKLGARLVRRTEGAAGGLLYYELEPPS